MLTDSTMMSRDTQVVLLLCGRFSKKENASALSLSEYNALAGWLRQNGLRPADLLDPSRVGEINWLEAKMDPTRAMTLLERGAALALAVEKWASMGLWALSRVDDDYPSRLRDHLGRNAPALLYGAGDRGLLERGGLAIVGSRDVDGEGESFTADVARTCAEQRINVVSGGARGVDQIAIGNAGGAGGTAIAVLPEGLGKESLASKYREGIREERLALVSPFSPEAGFSVGNAMGRNKLVYALADAALVVSTSLRKGGTWGGAEEELKRERSRPVWVRLDGNVPEGNVALSKIGARSFPAPPWQLDTLFDVAPRDSQLSIADAPAPATTDQPLEIEASESGAPGDQPAESPFSVYDAVLPLILAAIERSKEPKTLAGELDVAPAQLNAWLKRGVEEGLILKKTKPVRYVRARGSATQAGLGFGGKS